MPGAHADEPAWVQRVLKWSIFLSATGLVVYLCLLVLHPFLNVIAWSTVLAITCYPLHQRLVQKTGRPALSAFVSSALVVLGCLIPLLLIAGVAVSQFRGLVGWLQEGLHNQNAAFSHAALAFDSLMHRVGLEPAAIIDWGRQHSSDLASKAGQYTFSIAASVARGMASFVFIIFALFLLLRDGESMAATVVDLLPFERARSEALLFRIRDVVRGCVYGVVVIALIQGGLCGGMFWLLGIPWAALWGFVTVLSSTIPVIGAAGVWIPGAVYLMLTRQWPQAIILAVWGAAVVSSVDNFLRPRLVAGRVGLSEIVMFFALLGGVGVFGVLGIVLGPVIFATAIAIIDVLIKAQPSSSLGQGEAP
jgi:predicted PurR-regulated permease PerM